MKLKNKHGAIEIKSMGIRLTQNSSEDEIKRALKHAPHLSSYIDGTTKPVKDVKAQS